MHPDDEQLLLGKDAFSAAEWKQIKNFRQYVVNFVKANNLTKGIELGVRKGQLLFMLLDQCPKLSMLAVDAWIPTKADNGSEWPHREYEKYVRKTAEKYADRVRILKGLSQDAVKQVKNNQYDFIFIDADHSYNACKQDILLWVPKIKHSGWLLGDDVDRASGVKKAVNELLPGWKQLSPNIWYRKKVLF